MFLKTCVIIMLAMLSIGVHAETYFNKWYQANLEFGPEWQKVESSEKYHILSLFNEESGASLNLTAITYKEALVTVNGFQMKRVAASYDGWQNLGERFGTESEINLANAEDAYVALYAKEVIGEDMAVKRRMIAEYYYILDNKGYVVSLSVDKSEWKKVQNKFKEIVASFWIGEGDRPKYSPKESENVDWEMIGKNSQNHNSVDASFRVQKDLALNWLVTDDIFEGETLESQPLFSNGEMYVRTKHFLAAISAYDGDLLWKYRSDAPFVGSLAVHATGVICLIEGKLGSFSIVSLNRRKGSLSFKKELDGSLLSSPVISGQTIWVQSDSGLQGISAKSGELVFLKEGTGYMGGYPVVTEGFVVVLEAGNTLAVYNIQTAQAVWKRKFTDPLHFSPLISNNYVILAQIREEEEMPALFVQAIHLTDGKQEWSQSLEGVSELRYPPALSENALYLPVQDQGQPSLVSVDVNTGARIWVRQLNPSQEELDFGYPLVGGNAIYTLISEENVTYLDSIDTRTGQDLARLDLSTVLAGKNLSFLQGRVYKNKFYVVLNKPSVEIASLK